MPSEDQEPTNNVILGGVSPGDLDDDKTKGEEDDRRSPSHHTSIPGLRKIHIPPIGSRQHHPQHHHQGGPLFEDVRVKADRKVVGLKDYGMGQSSRHLRKSTLASLPGDLELVDPPISDRISVEDLEEKVRTRQVTNPCRLLVLGNLAALRVMVYYLITWETIIACVVTSGLTLYWYYAFDEETSGWNGGGLDFILLAFVVTSPISAALGMAFTRRERALVALADFRSFSYHLYLAHAFWDWNDGKGRADAAKNHDWLVHCDAVQTQLVGIGDELSRFLTLPTTSRSRHRMTKAGRKEAAKTMEVAYFLLESMTTQRMTRLMLYSERIKAIGLPSGELSRMRQYERFLSNNIEQLRMVKMYRTPQAFRSFARLFTVFLPPFYAPTYAQVAKDVNSLGVGVAFGLITALALTALFETLQVLEDPFTAFLALDGIDVREEFEVLHFSQLVNTRALAFPDAPQFPVGRRRALVAERHGKREDAKSGSLLAGPTQHSSNIANVGPPSSNSNQEHLTIQTTTHPSSGSSNVPNKKHFLEKQSSLSLDTPGSTSSDHCLFRPGPIGEQGRQDITDTALNRPPNQHNLHTDVELGAPILDEDMRFLRQSSFAAMDGDEANLPTTRLRSRTLSTASLTSQRHRRGFSKG